MEDIIISFIIPVYNVENYLKKCIESILNQITCSTEIILVDDGSTDNSSSIAKSFAKNNSQIIKYFYKKNGGLSSARNFGLKKSRGKYISFVDSDDYLNENFYKTIIPLLSKDYDIIRFNFCKIYNGEEFNECEQTFNNISDLKRAVLCDLVGSQACKNIFKRSLILNTYFKEGVLYEDLYWTHQIYYKTDSIIAIKENLYCYLMRQESISHASKREKVANDMFYGFLAKTEFAHRIYDDDAIKILTKKTIDHALTNMLYAKRGSISFNDSKNFVKKNKSLIENRKIKFLLVYYFNYFSRILNKFKLSR